ncbi:docking protein 3 [Pundamilia nyererei]|uniref:Docking protein 3 n=1 Tax=Pundamilia nyererei TaxID=303518 RepID=A0A9Y3QLZ1_9CICH|nr:PREDICTED: docking protein 3 [Pundamilia nyererei]
MEVIFKEGMLYLQAVKFGKKTWRKMWMVLYKPSSQGVGRLEFYALADSSCVTEQKRMGRQKTPERKVVRLIDCLSVTFAPKESCPAGCTAFYLNTTQSTYILASTSSQDWVNALCHLAFQKDPGESDKGDFEQDNGLTMADNDLYASWKSELTLPPNQYQVTIQSTEASKRCKLSGKYLVSIEGEAIELLDMRTRYIIFDWPYKLLRKFGQIEGGFSIEAGRRCKSGQGVFMFLTQHGPQIFQTISKQCTVERNTAVQPPSANRRSLIDPFPAPPPATAHSFVDPSIYSFPDVSADTEDKFTGDYPIYDDPVQQIKQLSLKPPLLGSNEAVAEESEDEDEQEWCYSLEALNLDNNIEDSIYCNLPRGTPPLMRKAEADNSDCIYSGIKKVNSLTNLQQEPSYPPLPLPVPPPPPLSSAYSLAKPQNQHALPVNNSFQPEYNTQADYDEDDLNETEEANSSSAQVTPSEVPGSFKHRLAEIISKDLAKFQPPLPYGASSLTFSQ